MAATSDSRATYYSSTTINYLGGQIQQLQLIPDQIIPPDQLWQWGISYGSNKWSGGSVTAATSDPGGSVIGGDGLLHDRPPFGGLWSHDCLLEGHISNVF